MANLKTKYLGLELKNPIIIGSSGLTNNIEKLKKAEENGAGAVILKSLFEEQIRQEGNKAYSESCLTSQYPEAETYILNYVKNNEVKEYLTLIKEAKKELSIPIIASINCVSSEEWTGFAKKIETAGADALELNIFILPSDAEKSSEDYEEIYFDIIEKVKEDIEIPIALKISSYFSGFAEFAKKLSWSGIKGLVLFNRFFSPDINLEKMRIIPTNVYSTPNESANTLRWVAMLSDVIQCDIAASTGIHDGEAVIKQILAGASAVQICSVVYKNGFEIIRTIVSFIEEWMDKNQYNSIEDIKGKLSFKTAENPSAYTRVQFMKHFAGIE